MIRAVKAKILNLVKSMLKEGMSLRKISLCIAVGIVLGIFPVLGTTTLLCTVAALALRLNLPAVQIVNYMVYPLQLVLLARTCSTRGRSQGALGIGQVARPCRATLLELGVEARVSAQRRGPFCRGPALPVTPVTDTAP